MPSKKKKYNARFPPGRIKKIMQTDEEVGKVAQAVPIIISRTLELFVHSLLTKAVQITNAKQAKTLSPAHMKQCILSESRFDFLKDLVVNIPDASTSPDEDNHNNFPLQTPLTQALPIPTTLATSLTIAPKLSTAVPLNASKDDSSCAKVRSRRRSSEKGDKPKQLSKPVVGSESVFSYGIPKLKTPVPTTFNASRPNFYTEVNSNSSDKPSKSDLVSQTVSSFSRAATLDEDYDT